MIGNITILSLSKLCGVLNDTSIPRWLKPTCWTTFTSDKKNWEKITASKCSPDLEWMVRHKIPFFRCFAAAFVASPCKKDLVLTGIVPSYPKITIAWCSKHLANHFTMWSKQMIISDCPCPWSEILVDNWLRRCTSWSRWISFTQVRRPSVDHPPHTHTHTHAIIIPLPLFHL